MQKHFSPILHPLSPVIFATAPVVAFVLLRNSRFNFHCNIQREAMPTQKSARKWQLRPLATSWAKDYKGHSLVQTSFTEPPITLQPTTWLSPWCSISGFWDLFWQAASWPVRWWASWAGLWLWWRVACYAVLVVWAAVSRPTSMSLLSALEAWQVFSKYIWPICHARTHARTHTQTHTCSECLRWMFHISWAVCSERGWRLIDDRLYSAILRSLEQTHCARRWFYMSD